MSVELDPAVASAIADLITARVDAGAGAGTIKVYTGTHTGLDPTGDTLLATFTLVDPAAAAAVAGVATWDTTPQIDAVTAAAGTPGWFLVEDSDGNNVFGGDVAAAGAAMNASSTTWAAGETVSLTAGTVTTPDSA